MIDSSHPLFAMPFSYHLVCPDRFPWEKTKFLRCGNCEAKAGFVVIEGTPTPVCPECGAWAITMGDFLVSDFAWSP